MPTALCPQRDGHSTIPTPATAGSLTPTPTPMLTLTLTLTLTSTPTPTLTRRRAHASSRVSSADKASSCADVCEVEDLIGILPTEHRELAKLGDLSSVGGASACNQASGGSACDQERGALGMQSGERGIGMQSVELASLRPAGATLAETEVLSRRRCTACVCSRATADSSGPRLKS